MNILRAPALVLALSAVAAGCGETHNTMMDAEITFDAGIPDTPDAGPAGSLPGDACRDDTDCDGEGAFCDPEYPGGYCTAGCDPDLPCPDGSTCIETRMGSSCFGDCDLTAADGDFCPRDGYGCLSELSVCLPGCDVDTECADGLVCDPGGGFNGSGQCSDPSAALGDACAGSEECAPGQICLSERFSGIPGGVCGAFGCDPDTGTGCPDNGTCIPAGHGGVCLLACEDDAGCTRAGQSCTPSDNGGYCGPDFVDASLGQVCSAGRGGCTGGICATEGETGFPDSYCMAVGCDPVAQTGCPGDGVCIDGADGAGVCLDGCATTAACRTGYDCLPADASDPTSPTACVPGCDDSSVCGNMGFACNTGTGLCTEPFVGTRLSEPCMSNADCPGGLCLTEGDAGWPAGTCTYPGCRLSGTGREATCPMSSTCVDDGAGDPELGVCVVSCATAASGECRPGYACVELSTGSAEGACRPACTASDCGTGRTCNTTSGLCVTATP